MKTELEFIKKESEEINPQKEEIIRYFQEAGPDYAYWSKNFNMHFGYYDWGMNPFGLEAMLEKMNEKVYKALRIPTGQKLQLGDMGCGIGRVCQYFAKQNPAIHLKGISLVPWQINEGNKKLEALKMNSQVELVQGDYTQTPWANASFDRLYAIESSCYAGGAGKEDLIKELSRLSKSGGRIAIVDGFMKKEKMPRWLHQIYRKVCNSWAIGEFGNITQFADYLAYHGFENIEIKEISWRVAPSFLYIPWTTVKFFFREIYKEGTLNLSKERYNNVIAPLLGMVLGLSRNHFGYYLVTADKK